MRSFVKPLLWKCFWCNTPRTAQIARALYNQTGFPRACFCGLLSPRIINGSVILVLSLFKFDICFRNLIHIETDLKFSHALDLCMDDRSRWDTERPESTMPPFLVERHPKFAIKMSETRYQKASLLFTTWAPFLFVAAISEVSDNTLKWSLRSSGWPLEPLYWTNSHLMLISLKGFVTRVNTYFICCVRKAVVFLLPQLYKLTSVHDVAIFTGSKMWHFWCFAVRCKERELCQKIFAQKRYEPKNSNFFPQHKSQNHEHLANLVAEQK